VDDVTGFLVPSGDVAAIAGKVAILREDHERTAQMGAAAREHAERSFSWDIIVAQLARRFEELVRKDRKS
jgi:glycosyltransferase involved in cell wall biosynthesis